MKFPKFRNSIRIVKGLVLIIPIFLASLNIQGQNLPINPQENLPNQPTQNPSNLPTPANQSPNSKPKTEPAKRNTPLNRVPMNDPKNLRTIEMEDADIKAIQQEEQQRIYEEQELAKDLNKSRTIKRTFGSSIFANNKFDASAAINIATPSNYVLGPGDKLNLDIYGYSQFRQVVTVNSDGFVVLEKAGIVNISGLTIEEAEKKIKTAFSKIFLGLNGGGAYPANTYLKVSLTGYRTVKIKITGEVVAPGTYTVTSFTSMLNALYTCGGPNHIGTYREIRLIRNNRIVSTLDLYEVITKGYSKGDMLVKDQDIIQVGPFVSRIAIEGNVKRTGLFEILPNETLQDALNYGGGFDQYAYTDRIKVYRNTPRERKILDVKSDSFKNVNVFSGDSIVVEKLLERFENLVSIEGAIFRPGEYSLDANPTLLSLIKSAEGLKEEALQGRVTIIRTNDDLTISNISVNLIDVMKERVSDLTLRRQDRIIIPSIFDLTEVSYIRIQGAINNPDAAEGVEVPYVKNMSIEDLIVQVGGLTEAASLSKIELVRRKRNVDPKQIDAQISEIIEFEINSDFSVDSKKNGFVLLPYDEVFVRTSPNYEKQNFVFLKGEVIYPGKYGVKYKDEKISDVVSRAGGLSPLAYTKGTTLIRKTLVTDFQRTQREDVLTNLNINTRVKNVVAADDDLEDPILADKTNANNQITESIGIDLNKILLNPGSADDLILQDGDEIFIPKRLQTVRIEGEILYPTTVKYQPGLRFRDYVSRSGGFTKKSSRKRAFVIYPNGAVDRTRGFLFVQIRPKIEPGSEIIVPARTENAQNQLVQFGNIVGTLSGTLTAIVGIFSIVQLNKIGRP